MSNIVYVRLNISLLTLMQLEAGKMLSCNPCGKSVKTLRVMCFTGNRNEPRCLCKWFGAGCKQTFSRYGDFKAYYYWRHNVVSANETIGTAVTSFTCGVALCERQRQDTKEPMAHLKEHIIGRRAMSRHRMQK